MCVFPCVALFRPKCATFPVSSSPTRASFRFPSPPRPSLPDASASAVSSTLPSLGSHAIVTNWLVRLPRS